jgi:hypothetical protein
LHLANPFSRPLGCSVAGSRRHGLRFCSLFVAVQAGYPPWRRFSRHARLGGLGWTGARGRSALWISAGFWREYHTAQAVKLAIIDAAFAAVLAQGARSAIAA